MNSQPDGPYDKLLYGNNPPHITIVFHPDSHREPVIIYDRSNFERLFTDMWQAREEWNKVLVRANSEKALDRMGRTN